MKLYIKLIVVLVSLSLLLEAGLFSKVVKSGKGLYKNKKNVIKKGSKKILKPYRKEVRGEIIRFNIQKDELLKNLKKKQKKHNKKKKKKSNKTSISIASWNLNNISINSDKNKIDYLNLTCPYFLYHSQS